MRQEIVAERLLGRVNATLQFLALCGALAGGLLGGILGELIGVRSVLAIGGGATLLTAIWIGFSPLGRYRSKES
jgi:MFS family permease